MMGSTGSHCPEDGNSTDCLLRTLLQLLNQQQKDNDAEINWEPINFAFTLLIGLLALIFALVTIIQAILATAKSRRMTSHRAIGNWSTKTRKSWSWTEINFQYTAFTPILMQSLLLAAQEGSSKESGGGDHVDKRSDKPEIAHHCKIARTELADGNKGHAVRPIVASRHGLRGLFASQLRNFKSWSGASKPSSAFPPHHSSAAWLEFFKVAGLYEWEDSVWNGSIREVAADSLPDDLIAAPAYGQVGAIIAAAATVGIQKLYIDQQNYPIVIGHGFQIDFRQHPSLGLVGAYSRYGSRPARTGQGLEELQLAIQHGQGFVEFVGLLEPVNLYAKSMRQRMLGGLNGRLELASLDHRKAYSSFHVRPVEMYLPLIVGLMARIPKHIPALFPVAPMRISFALTALALNGTYWAKENLSKYGESHIYEWPGPYFTESWDGFKWRHVGESLADMHPDIGAMYLDLGPKSVNGMAGMKGSSVEESQAPAKTQRSRTGTEVVAEPADELTHAPATAQAHGPTSKTTAEIETTNALVSDSPGGVDTSARESRTTDGHLVVLHMCLKLLHQPEELSAWFFEGSPLEQRALRSIILEQMKQVDQWLDSRGASFTAARKFVVYNTTVFVSQAERIIEDTGRGILDQDKGNVRPQESVQSARTIHCHTLRVLRETLRVVRDSAPLSEENKSFVQRLRGLTEPASSWQEFCGGIEVLVRENLGSYMQSDQAGGSGEFGEAEEKEKSEKWVKNTDDVIIYRCLMTILLFQTAPDSSKILESGLWEMVVPFL